MISHQPDRLDLRSWSKPLLQAKADLACSYPPFHAPDNVLYRVQRRDQDVSQNERCETNIVGRTTHSLNLSEVSETRVHMRTGRDVLQDIADAPCGSYGYRVSSIELRVVEVQLR